MENENLKLKELKTVCSQKKNEVTNLYNKVITSILNKDMDMLIKKHNDIKKVKPNFYKSDFIEYHTDWCGNDELACFNIFDNRKEIFGWLFGVKFADTVLKFSDEYVDEKTGLLYYISEIDKVDNKNVLLQIENVIKQLDNSIQFLKNNNITQNEYYYESDSNREYTKCLNIFEVYNTVINRK